MDPQAVGFKPPYMSFQTLWNFLEDTVSKPLPPQIDKSLMASKSGTDQNNLTAALTGFGFTDPAGVVTDRLHLFAKADPDERKTILAGVLRELYPAEVAVSEANATIKALQESFEASFGITSVETRRKCMTFFQHALMTAGLHVSANFPKTRSGSGAPGRPKPKRPSRKKADGQGGTPPPDNDGTGDGSGKVETPSLPLTSEQMKARYFQLLVEKAQGPDETDSELLDRIERLLGVPAPTQDAQP